MDETELSVIASKALVEVVKDRSKDIYDDGLKPLTREGGEALQAIVGLFNNVVLYPVKKANITYKYKLDQFENDLRAKLSNIPEGDIIEPPLTISGPTLESLKYTFDTKELREMYLNLLVSSMNSKKITLAHPAYVDIIKSMSPLDAIVFSKLSALRQTPSARISILFDTSVYVYAMPKIFAPDLIGNDDPFLISSSIENLCRLGILSHKDGNTINGYSYDTLKNNEYVKQRFELYKKIDASLNLEIKISPSALLLTDFGTNFASACL